MNEQLPDIDTHPVRPDDDPAPGDHCRDCGRDITWMGPSVYDWEHVQEPHGTVKVERFTGDDGTPVVQIDTQAGLGRVRINLNDAPVWDGDPERDEQPILWWRARLAAIVESWQRRRDRLRTLGTPLTGPEAIEDCATALRLILDESQRQHGAEAPAGIKDRDAVDAIAVLLGTTSDWDADILSRVAGIIATVRPDPADHVDSYPADFRSATGRTVPLACVHRSKVATPSEERITGDHATASTCINCGAEVFEDGTDDEGTVIWTHTASLDHFCCAPPNYDHPSDREEVTRHG